ncbi:MAG: nuclear transport factor 2 family protein [Flavobacteriales bacterium]
MKSIIIYKKIYFSIFFLASVLNLNAQEENLADVKSEIIKLSEIEINAFRNGDCETMIDLLADDITFFANGRKAPSKEMILGFCKRVPRPFEKPSLLEIEYIPISKNTAYVIRIMEFSKNEKVYKKEIVTKIWIKGIKGWKIAHLHSTIKEI